MHSLLPSPLVAEGPAPAVRSIDLRPAHDAKRICHNPQKGWYLHYHDNRLWRYNSSLPPGDLLTDFPGLSTIYLRQAWAYLEPEPGRFRWDILDRVIDTWVPTGRTIAFCVTCKETEPEQPYATPAWVQDLGARGTWISSKASFGNSLGHSNWEPDYGDPVFLDRLRAFHEAFAARYDHQPWVEWIDVGSYGDWGEGHNAGSSRHDWPPEVIETHLDIHRAAYRRSLLVANDDLFGSRHDGPEATRRVREAVFARDFALADWGVCVDWFAERFGPSTLRDPDTLRLAARRHPLILEVEHYATTKKKNRWLGGAPLRLAIAEAQASFIGFHGYPREWLAENGEIAAELANKVGYWFFPLRVELPASLRPGRPATITCEWENRGSARAYRRHELHLRLRSGPAGAPPVVIPLPDSDCRHWLPGQRVVETLSFRLPEFVTSGRHEIDFALIDPKTRRAIQLPLSSVIARSDGAYSLGAIEVDLA